MRPRVALPVTRRCSPTVGYARITPFTPTCQPWLAAHALGMGGIDDSGNGLHGHP